VSREGTVTTWIHLLQCGQDQAAQRLWERYFPRLLEVARAKLYGTRKQVSDEEDVALSAFHSFVRAVADHKIPQLASRDDVWRTLVLITAGKAVEQRRRQHALKRGGGRMPDSPPDWRELDQVIGSDADPAFAAQMAEEFEVLLARLGDDSLREMALLKLEGYTNEEIAARLKCSPRSVTRRLTVIRCVWEETESGPTG
jgi:DNA-directed RNA polymerase specialized sigma24 family protein